MACKCPETSVLRALGRPLPRQHDCTYVAARNGLIRAASAQATKMARGDTNAPIWSVTFMASMDALARQKFFTRKAARR